MNFDKYIRIIEDFPKEGISFKDVTTLIKDGEAYRASIKALADKIRPLKVDAIVGPEARGFLFGAPVAYELGLGFIPVRKPGKLPGETVRHEYALEYGTDALEIHKDAIQKGMKVAMIDDLLATGGTILAAAKLVESLGGQVVHIGFLIELSDLSGRDSLEGYQIDSIIKY
jgi:adenine phosphoribosyltransferase